MDAVVSGDDRVNDDVVPDDFSEAALEGNVVSADVAEAEGELVGFGSVVAIASWSGGKGNVGSWGKSGNNSWGRNLRRECGWCVCWWPDDGDDWLGWSDSWGRYDIRRCEGRHVEAEGIDGGDADCWWCDDWWIHVRGCAGRRCDGGRGIDDDMLVDGNTVAIAVLTGLAALHCLHVCG